MKDNKIEIRYLKSLVKLMSEYKIEYVAIGDVKIKMAAEPSSFVGNASNQTLDGSNNELEREYSNSVWKRYADIVKELNQDVTSEKASDIKGVSTIQNTIQPTAEEGDQPLEMTEEELLYYSAEG